MESKKKSGQDRYFLDIRVLNGNSKKVFIEDKFAIGSSPEMDFYIDGVLKPIQCVFSVEKDVLSLCNEAGEKSFIGKQPLEQDRMYIVDVGDKITLQDKEPVTIVVGRKKIIPEPTPLQLDVVSLDKEVIKQERPEKKIIAKKMTEEMPYKEKIQEKKISKKVISDKVKEGVGPFTRFYALIVNICLVYGVTYYLIPFMGVQKEWNQLILNHIIPLSEKLIKLLPPIFYP